MPRLNRRSFFSAIAGAVVGPGIAAALPPGPTLAAGDRLTFDYFASPLPPPGLSVVRDGAVDHLFVSGGAAKMLPLEPGALIMITKSEPIQWYVRKGWKPAAPATP